MNREPIQIASPQLVTVTEAAAMLHLSARTLNNWRCAGDGPKYVKIRRGGGNANAGAVRYSVEELQKFIDSNTINATSAAATKIEVV